MLLSINGSARDTDLILTLNLTDLAALAKVTNNNFYADSDSWKSFSVEFISPISNQVKVVPFPIYQEQTTLEAPIRVSSFFEGSLIKFSRIIIYDKGNGYLPIERSDVADPTLFDFPFV